MRVAAVMPIALLVMLLQVTVFSSFELWGARPDLALSVVLFFSLFMERREALALGFAVGTLTDALSGGALGVHALGYMLVALAASRFREDLYASHVLTQVALAFPAALFTSVLVMARLWVLSVSFDAGAAFDTALASSLYTAALTPALFFALGPFRKMVGLYVKRDFLRV